MADPVSIEIDTSEVLERLAELGDPDKIRTVIAVTALAVQREAKTLVPVRTGRLRSSIRFRLDNDGFAADIFTDVEYAEHVEFGTSRMAAQPFLTPAAALGQIVLERGIQLALDEAANEFNR